MDFDPQQIISVAITGSALASIWFWIYSLIRKLNKDDFKWWLKVIIPQGILISYAAHLIWIF